MARVAKKRVSMGVTEPIEVGSVDENDARELAMMFLSEGIIEKVLKNIEGFQEERQRDMLPANRIRELPQFEVDDLVGRFDLDDEGKFIILKKPSPFGDELIDIDGRLVNQRGYFVDDEGNVITKDRRTIFTKHELDA